MAAVLACGPLAMLSHVSAARLWAIRMVDAARVDVTTPKRTGRSAPRGIRLHTTRRLEPADVTIHRGIPTTTPQRTLTDLAEVLTPRQLAKAASEAERHKLHAPIQPIHGRHGSPSLTALEYLDARTLDTKSPLEDAFLELVTKAGLPAPHVNVIIEGHECDFVWPQFRLIVETDGFATHGTRRGFRRDRARDVDLMIAGWRIARFTYEDVLHAPESVIASLVALTKKS
jgi:very-short-patch-repair endonuclease